MPLTIQKVGPGLFTWHRQVFLHDTTYIVSLVRHFFFVKNYRETEIERDSHWKWARSLET